jgi:alkanesulfonate monooxygenase SsuD/methylene tetrahydromethanopterin reductase-like flavin-dependent oxidoreductase (luciferase family)
MQVGMGVTFQGFGNQMSDADIWRTDLALAAQAEPLGFESIWTTEHHFTRYMMTPDPLQFLTYMAGRTEQAMLGTMVTVLPWRDPVRVAENIIVLDHMSRGRTILGIGRGTGPVEFNGFRVPMPTARLRFKETTDALLQALETGVMEYDGEVIKQPHVQLYPSPYQSFKHRVFSGTMSRESAEVMAQLGTGLLALPVKPWKLIGEDVEAYREIYVASTGEAMPPSIVVGWLYVDEDEERAREKAFQHIGTYYRSTVDHYGFDKPMLQNTEGYETHAVLYERLSKPGGLEEMTSYYVNTKPWGTPEQVFEKIKRLSEIVGADHYVGVFRYGAMSREEGERNMRLFAREVMPELRKLNVLAESQTATPA